MFKFKSKVTGDLILLETHGQQILKAMGKPAEPQGIIQVQDMAHCRQALEAAIAEEAQAAKNTSEASTKPTDGAAEDAPTPISFKHRALPMLDMIKQCEQAKVPIVWGV
jgi:hypothetical protein